MRYVRIKQPGGTLPKNIILNGKGVAMVKAGTAGTYFQRTPFEDYHKQGVVVGYLDVICNGKETINGVERGTKPELDMSAVYQLSNAPVEVVDGLNIVKLVRVETVRNKGV